jgi:lysine-specific demethylase 8
VVDTIPRIKAPSKAVFYEEYVYPQRPVILTGVFEGEPIRQIDSLARCKAELGTMPVMVSEGYEDYARRIFEGMMTPGAQFTDTATEPSTINDYLALVERDPTTPLICEEVPREVIEAIERRYTVPSYCRPEPGEIDDYTSGLWLGNGGNRTHLHWDGDCRHILQFQLWGKKRVVLVPSSESRKLIPLRNNALVSPDGLSEDEMDEFVNYVNGYQATLGEGETIFIPAMCWHYFDYLDTSMSLTLRWSNNRYLRFFHEKLHFDQNVQILATRFINPHRVDDEALAAFAEIQAEWAKPFDTAVRKGDHMHDVVERIARRLRPDLCRGKYRRRVVDALETKIREVGILVGGYYPEMQKRI